MSGEIEAAEARLRERVDAADVIGKVLQGVSEQEAEAEAVLRRMLSGLDLAFDELQAVMARRRGQAFLAAMMTGHPGLIAAIYFMEGIAIGLLVAEARDRGDTDHG